MTRPQIPDVAEGKTALVLHCRFSGTPLLSVTPLIGQWPELLKPIEVIHPIYKQPIKYLLARLNTLHQLQTVNGWSLDSGTLLEQKLLMSAAMLKLDALKISVPSLPLDSIAIGCLPRFYELVSWYVEKTTQRQALPIYHVSVLNPKWETLGAWIDALDTIKDEWENTVRKVSLLDSDTIDDANAEVKDSVVYQKLDFRKVWVWIDCQIRKEYAAGRIETFKSIFYSAEQNPEDWLPDDIDDLGEAIFKHCDHGNIVYHFISMRLNRIRHSINSFYGSFFIIESPEAFGKSFAASHVRTTQEDSLLEELDTALREDSNSLIRPERNNFPNQVAYMKALAKYNLLLKRATVSVDRNAF